MTVYGDLAKTPVRNVRVVGYFGSKTALRSVLISYTDYALLLRTGEADKDTEYVVCGDELTEEQKKALEIQFHYLQS